MIGTNTIITQQIPENNMLIVTANDPKSLASFDNSLCSKLMLSTVASTAVFKISQINTAKRLPNNSNLSNIIMWDANIKKTKSGENINSSA